MSEQSASGRVTSAARIGDAIAADSSPLHRRRDHAVLAVGNGSWLRLDEWRR
jgi:hypothetical protein